MIKTIFCFVVIIVFNISAQLTSLNYKFMDEKKAFKISYIALSQVNLDKVKSEIGNNQKILKIYDKNNNILQLKNHRNRDAKITLDNNIRIYYYSPSRTLSDERDIEYILAITSYETGNLDASAEEEKFPFVDCVSYMVDKDKKDDYEALKELLFLFYSNRQIK